MVVYNVENDLYASLVELLDHLLELLGCSTRAATICSISAHGGKKVDMRVTPDVDHVIPGIGNPLELQLIILKDRQQLHCIDAKLHQVRDLQAA